MTKILIISDGKPGHENQSMGIAERISGAELLLVKHGLKEGLSEGYTRWSIGRKHGKIDPGDARKRLEGIITSEKVGEIDNFKPGLVMSAGTTSATVNLLCKALYGIPSVCIMRPSLIPVESFDLVVLPAHDYAPDLPNVVRLVITPNRASPERVRHEATEFGKRTGNNPHRKYLAIIVGGRAKGLPFPEQTCFDMLDLCYRWAAENDIILLVTTSRRTGSRLESAIEEEWGKNPRTGYMLIAGKDKENPTYAFYGLAGRAIITADSLSMVSEAIYSGVCPLVVDLTAGRAGTGKRGRFFDKLRSGGFIDYINGLADLEEALRKAKPFAGAGIPDELGACLKRIESLVG